MIRLENRTIDEYGKVYFKVSDLYELILKDTDVSELLVEPSPEYEKLVEVSQLLDNEEIVPPVYEKSNLSLDEEMAKYRESWNVPNRYKTLDLKTWLLAQCETREQQARVVDELVVYERYDLLPMLRSLVFLIETLRKHKVLWGIGRGSSVSSYVLYLIGVHRVDSLKYNLDFSEFLN